MEMLTRLKPASRIARAVAGSISVPLVASAILRPFATAWRAMVKRSARYSGSPPVSTNIGFANDAISSTTRRAAAVSSSPEKIESSASARQCAQRRLQRLVSSQKMSRSESGGIFIF